MCITMLKKDFHKILLKKINFKMVKIEDRLRGFFMPNEVKRPVSVIIRNCSEAQNFYFGPNRPASWF